MTGKYPKYLVNFDPLNGTTILDKTMGLSFKKTDKRSLKHVWKLPCLYAVKERIMFIVDNDFHIIFLPLVSRYRKYSSISLRLHFYKSFLRSIGWLTVAIAFIHFNKMFNIKMHFKYEIHNRIYARVSFQRKQIVC